MSTGRRLVDFLGLRKNIVGLLGMVILVGIGEKMPDQFIPVFLIAVGGDILTPGIKGFLDNLLAAFYSVAGGDLSDRLGAKRALIACNLIAILGYAVVVAWPSWIAMLIGSLFFSAWSSISMPATVGLIAQALPRNKQTMGITVHSLVRRLPMALGPILGGLLIDRFDPVRGVQIGFGIAIGMAVLALGLQHFLIVEPPRSAVAVDSGPPRRSFADLWKALSPDLRNLLWADILIRFCEQIPAAYIVLWCVDAAYHPGGVVSKTEFGFLRAIEMATAMAVYLPVAWLADRGHKKPYVLLTFVFFTAFPLVLVHCRSFLTLAPAFVLRGLKEFGEPTRKALIVELAPADRKAAVFGFYYFLRDSVVALAALGGAFVWRIAAIQLGDWSLSGPELTFYLAGLCGVAGTVWFAWYGRDPVRPSSPAAA